MTRTTQETKTTAEQHNLLATLVALRGDVMTEGDKLLSLSRDLILRQEYKDLDFVARHARPQGICSRSTLACLRR
jgi:hypothetical protein